MLQDAGPKTVGVFFSFRFVLRTPHAVLCRPLPSDSVGPLYNLNFPPIFTLTSAAAFSGAKM